MTCCENLNREDLLPIDEVGSVEIHGPTIKVKLVGKFRVLTRKLPQPTFGAGCWKRLFSTGAFGCRADKAYVTTSAATPVAVSVNVAWFSLPEIVAKGDEWFDRGLIEYAATVTPATGQTATVNFSVPIIASYIEEIADPSNPGTNITVMRVECDYPLSLLTVATSATLVGGCRRTIADCRTKHLPAGGISATGGRVQIRLVATGNSWLEVRMRGNAVWLVWNATFMLQSATVNVQAWTPTLGGGSSSQFILAAWHLVASLSLLRPQVLSLEVVLLKGGRSVLFTKLA
jgi:hypothetical protein